MLKRIDRGFEGQRVTISGSGNVAQFAAQKVMELGGMVVSLSDSEGTLHIPDGLNEEQWQYLMGLKNVRRGRLSEMAAHFRLNFLAGQRPWSLPCDIALPCATQNELNGEDARQLLKNGCICVAEGANMPSTLEAVDLFIEAGICFAPGKASNAGGVATSGLEMSQNAMRLNWTSGEVDQRLHSIMQNIHSACVHYGEENGRINYVKGANIAGFVKVADAVCWPRAWSDPSPGLLKAARLSAGVFVSVPEVLPLQIEACVAPHLLGASSTTPVALSGDFSSAFSGLDCNQVGQLYYS